MSIIDFIAVVSFGLTCFSIGYTFGKDNNKTHKNTPFTGCPVKGVHISLIN